MEWSGKESVGWRGKTGRGKFPPVGPLASVARGEMYPSPKKPNDGGSPHCSPRHLPHPPGGGGDGSTIKNRLKRFLCLGYLILDVLTNGRVMFISGGCSGSYWGASLVNSGPVAGMLPTKARDFLQERGDLSFGNTYFPENRTKVPGEIPQRGELLRPNNRAKERPISLVLCPIVIL